MEINRRPRVNAYYDTYKRNDLVGENSFLTMPQEKAELPLFDDIKHLLPDPYWEGHQSAVDCYWKTWQLAFKNLRKPKSQSGFVANYIDTAFNDCIFMWDTCFILMFGRYGTRAFNFLRTLDNFYAKQHQDGFICREIGQELGDDRFQRFDPTSTGPNVMPWTEWEYYLNFGNKTRIEKVFPVLRAYHQWLRDYRTWPDGSYWTSGWGCGMDNQPRLRSDAPWYVAQFYHDHMIWLDACLQQILSAQILTDMAHELGKPEQVGDMEEEIERLTALVNSKLWDHHTDFYYDMHKDGSQNGVKSIGAYWALLADVVPSDRLEPFVAHLGNTDEFNRPHRVPSLSYDHPNYKDNGGYWNGGVWPPTNYMVLRGLTKAGYDALAYEIGRNHLDMVVKVFEESDSVFENYAPEAATHGEPSLKDFVGWGGVPPVCVLLEYVIGLRADVPKSRLIWDINLLEEHGMNRYPFGLNGLIDLRCAARQSPTDEPRITATSTVSLELEIRWPGGHNVMQVMAAK